MAMHDIDRVIDIERDGAWWAGAARAIDIDHGVAHTDHLAQIRGVLPARHGRLRAQIASAVGQMSARQLEARIGAQMIEVGGILIAAGDGKHARPQNVGHAVGHEQRIARVGDQPGKGTCDPHAALGCGQQQHTAVGGDASAIEGGGHFLAPNGWETKQQKRIFGHGGCGSRSYVAELVSTPNL